MKTEDLVRVSKDYFQTVAVAGLKTAAIASFPFLAAAPFPYLMDQFLNWLVGKIADILEQAAFFQYTDFRVSKQGKEFVEAKINGYKAELNGSIEELKAAKERIKEALRNFGPFTA